LLKHEWIVKLGHRNQPPPETRKISQETQKISRNTININEFRERDDNGDYSFDYSAQENNEIPEVMELKVREEYPVILKEGILHTFEGFNDEIENIWPFQNLEYQSYQIDEALFIVAEYKECKNIRRLQECTIFILTHLPAASLKLAFEPLKIMWNKESVVFCVDSIRLLQNNLETLIGKARSEYLGMLVHIGYPIHFSRLAVRNFSDQDRGLWNDLVHHCVKLLYDLSNGSREQKIALGNPLIVRDLVRIYNSHDKTTQCLVLRILKNLTQIPENLDSIDQYDAILLLCKLIQDPVRAKILVF
jgi:hypothetical protein